MHATIFKRCTFQFLFKKRSKIEHAVIKFHEKQKVIAIFKAHSKQFTSLKRNFSKSCVAYPCQREITVGKRTFNEIDIGKVNSRKIAIDEGAIFVFSFRKRFN
jgi:hypothetical protein